MTRLSQESARANLAAIMNRKWRYLLRNPSFQRDMQSAHSAYPDLSGPFGLRDLANKIADEWCLPNIPLEAVIFWPGTPVHVDDYSELESLDIWNEFAAINVTEIIEDRHAKVLIDLSYPVSAMLPVLGEELTFIKRERGLNRSSEQRAGLDSNLAVFDQAVDGKTFAEIARGDSRNLSTVKSAYYAASRMVFESPGAPSLEAIRTKRLLDNFDPATHAQHCFTCKSAQRPEDFCMPAQRYANQDHVPQRETISPNPELSV